MLQKMRNILSYMPALFTAIVWGSTFVASKNVLSAGVSPILLMTVRFSLAYIILLMLNRQRMRFEFNTTELKLFLVGTCGGSVYFLVEYMALQHTSAVNVGLISATVPTISTAIDSFLRHKRLKLIFVVGSVVAFVGVALLVTNGKFSFQIFPFGDALAILSSMLWAIYSVVLSRVGSDIAESVVERRMLLYSLITIMPVTVYMFDIDEVKMLFSSVDVWLCAAYLGIVASAFCLWLWNVSINKIGIVRTNNFLYMLPVVSLIVSAIFTSGEVTMLTVISTVLIFVGIVMADC